MNLNEVTPNHSERAHARLSASGSERWMTCPMSVMAEDGFPDTSSEFAEEGTAAHELSEISLRLFTGVITLEESREQYRIFKEENKFFSQEMLDYVGDYVTFVKTKINESYAIDPNTQVHVEERVDFSPWVEGGFGTGDVLIMRDGHLEIIDLKYGKGIQVFADNNSQMKLYALGALNGYHHVFNFQTVTMTIVQPRLHSISSADLSVQEIMDWGECVVKPSAKAAAGGTGHFVPGDHCGFCKAKNTCAKRAEVNLKMAEGYLDVEINKLQPSDYAEILPKLAGMKKWANDMEAYILEQTRSGEMNLPGFKLVRGRGARKYRDVSKVKEILQEVAKEDSSLKYLKPEEILPITQMEKSLGRDRFDNLLGDMVVKYPGKLQLVEESDPRKAVPVKGKDTEFKAQDFL